MRAKFNPNDTTIASRKAWRIKTKQPCMRDGVRYESHNWQLFKETVTGAGRQGYFVIRGCTNCHVKQYLDLVKEKIQ